LPQWSQHHLFFKNHYLGRQAKVKVNVDLLWRIIVNTPLNRYRFPYISADHCSQPDTRPTLQDEGYGLLYHTMCLLILLGTHPAYPQRDGSGCAWFCAEVVY